MVERCDYNECKEEIDSNKPKYSYRTKEREYECCGPGCRDMWSLEERSGQYTELKFLEKGVIPIE